jgi:hypothetical protein
MIHLLKSFMKQKECFMKKREFVQPTVRSRLVAAFLLAAFLSMTCTLPDSGDSSGGTNTSATQTDTGGTTAPPVIPPGADIPAVPELPLRPAVFFLDENYQPTTEDTGRTGITAFSVAEGPSVLVSSEYTGSQPVVRFFGRSAGEEGAEPVYATVALTFADKDSLFPSTCQVEQRQGEETFTVNAEFSPYNSTTETFSVTYEYGQETFDNLVLNKNIFTAYQFTSEVSESQNIRMRNAVVAMGLWAALEIQAQERSLAVAVPRYTVNEYGAAMYLSGGAKQVVNLICVTVSVIAIVAVVVTCIPVVLTLKAAGNPVAAEVILTATSKIIDDGFARIRAAADAVFSPPKENKPEPEPPPPPPPSITGTTGPAGGVLIAKRESTLDYAMEVMPYTANTALTFDEAFSLNPTFGGFTGWRLPTHEELFIIYKLYLEEGKLEYTQISPLSTTRGSLWTGTTWTENVNYAVRLNLAKKATGDKFDENFAVAEKNIFFAATYIRKYPQE